MMIKTYIFQSHGFVAIFEAILSVEVLQRTWHCIASLQQVLYQSMARSLNAQRVMYAGVIRGLDESFVNLIRPSVLQLLPIE